MLAIATKKVSEVMRKVLVALDFDHTVIDANSDTFIYKLGPNEDIPDKLKALYRTDGWTLYMGEVFKYLHRNGVTSNQMLNFLSQIPLTDGMRNLFLDLPRDKSELIIISDSNNVFIEHILKMNGMHHCVYKVFTNHAEFDKNDCLHIEKYHSQDWCSISTNNMCKGYILSKFVEKRMASGVQYTNIAYVGDGFNDYCPCLRLQECDVVYPRIGYTLAKTIGKMELNRGLSLRAKVIPWKSGLDILNTLMPFVKELDNASLPVPRLYDPGDI